MQRTFCYREIYSVLNKRSICCTMRRNVSPPHYVELSGLFQTDQHYVITELLLFTVLLPFAQTKVKLEKGQQKVFFANVLQNSQEAPVLESLSNIVAEIHYATLHMLKFIGCAEARKFLKTCESKLFQDMMHDKLSKNILLAKL